MMGRTQPFGEDASSRAGAVVDGQAGVSRCGDFRPTLLRRARRRLAKLFPVFAAGVLCAGAASAPAFAACGPRLSAPEAVRLQTNLLRALGAEDRPTFDALTTRDLVLIEHGQMQDRDGMYGLIVKAHRGGAAITWRVTQAHLDPGCEIAVMRYLDAGTLRAGGKPAAPVQWLETAAFRREDARWKLFQMTSDRVGDMGAAGGGEAHAGAAASAQGR